MANTVSGLLVAVANHAAVVKVNGRANFSMSISFKQLIGELNQRGVDHFILDLTECITMDSTFLGVLAGTALKFSGREQRNPELVGSGETSASLQLLNPNQRVAELLDNLGVSELFSTLECERPVVTPAELAPAAEAKPSREELSVACLEAHRILMELNPQNISRFKDVAHFLSEDLKKVSADKKPANGGEEPLAEARPSKPEQDPALHS
jgi:anti-sigma B factor antagonist